jgi:hypothetical protein
MANLVKSTKETQEIARKSYAASQAKSLAEMLYLMGQQYRREITAEVSAFWTHMLIEREHLSPSQIREGFYAYFSNPEKCAFPPQPGDILGCIPEQIVTGYNLTIEEMRDLDIRKKQGEKFFSLVDVLKTAKVVNLSEIAKKL